MTGHLAKKGNRWYVVLNTRDPVTGKRKKKWISTGERLKRDAEPVLHRLLNEANNGTLVMPSKLTVEQYIWRWFESVAKETLRANTIESYEGIIRLHIVPRIGKVRLADLTPLQLQSLYADKRAEGLATQTVRHIHVVIRSALKQAVQWGEVNRNVADAVRPPAIRRKKVQVLSAAESARFLKAAEGDRLYALYVLALTTGMRQGELFGLRWSDVKLDDGVAYVQQTLIAANGKLLFEAPKTPSSRRRISLTTFAINALRKHRDNQIEEGLAHSELVFCSQVGTPLRCGNVTQRSFARILEKAKVTPIRFHDLRHTAATLFLKAGVHPKIVQEVLGHASISTTLDTYSHVLPNMQNVAVDAMSKLLDPVEP